MTPTLDVTETPEIAVLRGVDTDAALAHLCRSLVTGSVFDAYRALVIDLHGCPDLAASASGELDRAGAAYRQRHRWLFVVRDDDVADAVAQARRWLRLVDSNHATGVATSLLRANVAIARGVSGAAVGVSARIVRVVRDVRPARGGRTAL